MQPQTFIFFGPVGSGKGTQVELLTKFLKEKDGKDAVYAYPGNEFRRLIESGEYVGTLIKDSLNKGNLQPDFLTDAIVVGILNSSLSPDKHLVFDGYPRTLAQAETFEKLASYYKREDIKIIYIEVSKDEAIKRNMLRGRHDDTEEGLKRRFEEYENNVIPSMKYFQGKPGYEIFEINGEQTIEAVHQEIINKLGF